MDDGYHLAAVTYHPLRSPPASFPRGCQKMLPEGRSEAHHHPPPGFAIFNGFSLPSGYRCSFPRWPACPRTRPPSSSPPELQSVLQHFFRLYTCSSLSCHRAFAQVAPTTSTFSCPHSTTVYMSSYPSFCPCPQATSDLPGGPKPLSPALVVPVGSQDLL